MTIDATTEDLRHVMTLVQATIRMIMVQGLAMCLLGMDMNHVGMIEDRRHLGVIAMHRILRLLLVVRGLRLEVETIMIECLLGPLGDSSSFSSFT